MTDLVRRLRDVDHGSVEDCFLQSPLFAEAAFEIEKLRRERDEARAELAAVEEDRDRIRRERGMYCSALQRTEAERDALAADKARLEREKQDLDAIASSHALSLTAELNRRRSAEAREAELREALAIRNAALLKCADILDANDFGHDVRFEARALAKEHTGTRGAANG